MDYRNRQYYEKPTTKRNKEKRMALVRERRRQDADGRPKV